MASTNRKSQIVRNAFCRSFAAIGAMFAEFVVASAGFAKRKQSAGVPYPIRVLNEVSCCLTLIKLELIGLDR